MPDDAFNENGSMFEWNKHAAVDVVRGAEPINRLTAGDIATLIERHLQAGQPRLVLDLERVPLIDSAGLEMLLNLRDTCQRRGGSMKLAAPNALCRDILLVTDVGTKFEIFGDVTAAVGSFAQ